MDTYSRRKRARGQGLAEYALIIALVALIAVAVLVGLGMASNRNYALVAGSLGAQKNDDNASSSSTDAIDIEQADCNIVTSLNHIEIVISLNASSNLRASDFSISTPNGFLNNPLVDGGSQAFSQSTIIPGTVDPASCPKTVVVQANRAADIKTVTIHTF